MKTEIDALVFFFFFFASVPKLTRKCLRFGALRRVINYIVKMWNYR